MILYDNSGAGGTRELMAGSAAPVTEAPPVDAELTGMGALPFAWYDGAVPDLELFGDGAPLETDEVASAPDVSFASVVLRSSLFLLLPPPLRYSSFFENKKNERNRRWSLPPTLKALLFVAPRFFLVLLLAAAVKAVTMLVWKEKQEIKDETSPH